MTYPKNKLDASDAAGWYECDDGTDIIALYWSGGGLFSAIRADGSSGYAEAMIGHRNFRPLAPAPEVVEGPTYESLPQGTWLLLNQHSGRPSGVVESNGSAVCDNGTYVKLDSLLAAITKPEPGVTERHREAAKKLAEVSPDDDAELLREYERILAGCFPVEATK